MEQHNIRVEKTARYFTSGEFSPGIKTVLFACHGYAQLANEFLEAFKEIQREDLLLVAPEGLHRFYARGSSEKVVASWMTKEDRGQDIHDYVLFLDKVYDEVMEKVPAQVNVIVLGFSQGAATASRWAAMGKRKINELVLWCGFFPPDLPPNSVSGKIKLTVVTASDDRFVSPEQEQTQLEQMRKLALDFRHIQFQGGHAIDAATLQALL